LRTSADTKTKGEFNKLAFDDVEADIERLEPVQQVLRELGPVGIYTLDDLVAVDAKKLSEYLDGGAWAMSELEVARLQRIAKFEILVRDLVPPATVAPVRVELLKLLLDDNIETPASIPDIWTTGADPAVAEFAKKIKDAFDKVVKPGEITAWLKALKDWKPPTAPTLTPSSP
jgi:hypothetical protein